MVGSSVTWLGADQKADSNGGGISLKNNNNVNDLVAVDLGKNVGRFEFLFGGYKKPGGIDVGRLVGHMAGCSSNGRFK